MRVQMVEVMILVLYYSEIRHRQLNMSWIGFIIQGVPKIIYTNILLSEILNYKLKILSYMFQKLRPAQSLLHSKCQMAFHSFTGVMKFPYYRVIHKSLRYFRLLQYGSLEGHAEGEPVNRGRDTPICCAAEFGNSGGTYELPRVVAY